MSASVKHTVISLWCVGRLEERAAMCHTLRPSAPVYAPGDRTSQDSWFVWEKCRVRQGGYVNAGWGMGLQMGHSRRGVGQGGRGNREGGLL